MLEEALAEAAQRGGVPVGWSNTELVQLAARHFLLALYAIDNERRRWHLRQHNLLLDLLATKAQFDQPPTEESSP